MENHTIASSVLECIPNVSEGCDSAVVDGIAAAVCSTGARLLDVHSDCDHHRSVFTMVGQSEDLQDALLALVEQAIARIDIRCHQGVHPRVGAVDVIPLVPIGQATLESCIAMAVETAREIADWFRVPVILFGAAARTSQYASLAAIRRGGLPAVANLLARSKPDFGPARLHPSAGATIVGARRPLVAYNVMLASQDVKVAKAIATQVRERNGGLVGVQALGFPLASRGMVQVSMNLTDVASTTVLNAFRAVEALAQHRGVRVVESEIVGLAPAIALTGATAQSVCMRSDPQLCMLERRMEPS